MTAKPQTLDTRTLNRTLLARQWLLERRDSPIVEAVDWLNGLQAQEARPPFIALWSRLKAFRREALLDALADRSVVKATFTRGTLHLVSAGDYCAFRSTHALMLEAAMRPEMSEITKVVSIADVVAAGRAALEAGPLAFADLQTMLAEQWPGLNGRHLAYAVRLNLPLVATPHDGPWGGKAGGTFALADHWLGRAPDPKADVAGLVRRYLDAFGPATVADIQTFTAMKSLKAVVDGMELATYRNEAGKTLYDVKDGPVADGGMSAPARFVADFDGIMLGHADRARVIDEEDRKRLWNQNLRVPAVFLVDGFAAGSWSLTASKTRAVLTATPFGTLTRAAKTALAAEGEALLRFAAPEAKAVEVVFS